MKFALLGFLLIQRLGTHAVLHFLLHGFDESLQLNDLHHLLLVLNMTVDYEPANGLGNHAEADGGAHGDHRDVEFRRGTKCCTNSLAQAS